MSRFLYFIVKLIMPFATESLDLGTVLRTFESRAVSKSLSPHEPS